MAFSRAESAARSISRAIAVHKVLISFVHVPRTLGLEQISSFDTLDSILEKTVLEMRLLERLNLDFIKAGNQLVHVGAGVDWKKKRFSSSGVEDDGEDVSLDDEDDFETSLSKKLKIFRKKTIELVRARNCDSADWSIVLRGDQELKNDVERIWRAFDLGPVSQTYVDRVAKFEDRLRKDGMVGGSYSTQRIAGFGLKVRAVLLK